MSIDSFQAVTGPKRDLWLVKTLGALIMAVGVTILVAGFRHSASTEILVLSVGSAVALMMADIIYSVRRIISYVYLVDAAAEFGIVAMYAVAFAVRSS